MKLALSKKLVDINTGKVAGLLYQDLEASFTRLIPFKLDVAKSLGLPDADIAEYMELDTLDVLVHNNSYALVSNALYSLDDRGVPFEIVDGRYIIWGYLFERSSIVDFVTSLEDADYSEDKLC